MKKFNLLAASTLTYLLLLIALSTSQQTCKNNSSSTGAPGSPGKFSITSAVAGNGRVALTWAPSAGATSYTIQRGTSSKSYSTTVSTKAMSPYFDTGLTNGKTYYYIVIAVNSNGSTSADAEISATPSGSISGSPPGSFTITSAVAGNGQVTLTWAASFGASSYTVLRGTSSGSYPTTASTTATSPYIDKGLTNNTTYYYQVTAINTAGSTRASAEISAMPFQWGTKQLGIMPQNGMSYDTKGKSVAIDSTGNVFVVGYTTGGLDGNTLSGKTNFFITKYDKLGTKQWTTQVGTAITPPSRDTYAYGVAVDLSGNVYVTGYTNGNLDGTHDTISATANDYFIAKYHDNGATASKQWVLQASSSSSTNATHGNSVAVDSTGNVYVAGTTNDNLDNKPIHSNISNDFFITKYDTNEKFQWVVQVDASQQPTYGKGIAVDSSGNVYVAGTTYGSLDGTHSNLSGDLFVTKYNKEGTFQWLEQLDVPTRSNVANSVAVDLSGNVYVTGYTNGNLDGKHAMITASELDFFVVKYYDDGTSTPSAPQWAVQTTTNLGGGQTQGNSVAVDSAGNVYVAGTTNGNLDGNHAMIDPSENDFFIAKYHDDGTSTPSAPQWIKQLGASLKTTLGNGVAIDSVGNAYVSGYTNGGLDNNTVSGPNNSDFFVTKFDSTGTEQ